MIFKQTGYIVAVHPGAPLISLGSLFNRQQPPLLGVDISSSSVTLVELSRNSVGRLVLERCAIEPLDVGWVTDGNIEKFDEVANVLRRVVKKSGTRTRNVAMALPPSAVISKKIILPGGLSDAELEIQVESEANKYIPFSLDEVSLDFCLLGPSATSSGDVEVLIAASRKEKVQDRQGLAEAAGLKPIVVDVESYASRLATARLIENMPNKGVDTMVALFEIGSVTTSMQVIRNDEVLYERDQAFGGAQLTQLIVRQYGFSLEEAETKKRGGELPEDYALGVLKPFVESMTQEISRALQFFFTSTPYNRVDYVMLAGGSSSLGGLTESVTEQTAFACQMVNPFDGMEIGSGVMENKMRREASSYLTACGLALRRFAQ
ncbi:type IV pilus assembly protein PilM [Polaromonas sp. CG_9.11]|nr:type IV pilus assembly protein PilM [Polaromonas sp. CG_9.11]